MTSVDPEAPRLPLPPTPPSAAPRVGIRGRMTNLVVGLLVGALLVAYGVLLLSSAAPAATTGGPVPFVPDDGSRFPATFTQHSDSGPAMVENARLHGRNLTFGASAQVLVSVDPPEGGLAQADWWREAVVPGDTGQPSRYRIRSFDQHGIWLRVQDWQELGISFEHLLELPADVAAGRSWNSTGLAVAKPTSVQLTYRNTASAAQPADPGRAAQGCLTVTSTTTLAGGERPETWRETNLWCPGAGVVMSEGSFRGTAYRIEALPAPPVGTASLATGDAAVADVAGWTVREESLLDGDQTFGGRPARLGPDLRPVVSASGTVTFPVASGDNLTALLRTVPGSLWWHWWARPGGYVTAMAAVGRLVAVTTTRRELTVYDAGGRWLWSVPLDDVALAPPLELPGDRIAVATVGGTVAVYDARTGARAWQQRLTYGVFNSLATDGQVLAVADVGPQVTAFDLSTGRQLWQNETGSEFGTTLAVGEGSVAVAGGGAVTAYDTRTGRQRWHRTVGLGLDEVVKHDDQLWIGSQASRVESWGLADGRTRWTADDLRPAPPSRCRLTDGSGTPLWLAFRGDELVAMDGGGRVRQAWSVPGDANTVRSADCGGGRILVTAYAPNGASDLRVFSIGPP